MINKTTIWQHIMQTMNAFTPFYHDQAVYNLRQARARQRWLPLLKTAVATSSPLTAGSLATSIPYTAEREYHEMLDGALKRGLLAEEGPIGYRLTEQGKDALAAFFNCAQAAIAGAPVLPQEQMDELASLLLRIVLATERLPLPHLKMNFESSRWTDPGPQAPAPVRVDQYLTDLVYFRDDAHLSSWQAYGVDGRTWEAFTLIWRDQANSPADLAERLSQRGYNEEDYTEAVQLLLDKGWIEQALGRWQLSANGRALRDVSEMVTDRLFFAPWRTLDERELERLNELLINLNQQLQQSEAALLPA